MALSSTLFLLFLSVILVFGQLQQRDRTTREPRKGEPMEELKTRSRGRQQRSVSSQGNLEFQEGNPLGASYLGSMNVTTSGRTCQAWTPQEPHEHSLSEVGEHNHCMNPVGDSGGVWCYTTDPDKRWEHCSVPICARGPNMMKVLDFSADSDQEADSNGEYTGATLEAGPLPESFTICSAFMTEAWTTEFMAVFLFRLYNDDGYKWIHINFYAASSYTEFGVSVGQARHLNQTEDVFFPLQWTRACLSLDSSRIKLVANGQLLVDGEYKKGED